MCGIFGFNFSDANLAISMKKLLHHRGPDHDAVFQDDNMTIGYTRLSIIDLEGGNQPMESEDGSLVLFFNGEVYNYKELRERLQEKGHKFQTDSDTEVVLHLYEEYGYSCALHITGMFAFVIYNKNTKEIYIARDRLGIKPLYYYHDSNVFIFASEIKAILAYDELIKHVNYPALNDYLTYRYCTGQKTMLKNILKLLPGHYLRFANNILDVKRYWELNFEITNYNRDFYVKRFKELLKQSTEDVSISDVPIGVLLSGGLDSSSVVGMMDNSQEIDTFTAGFDEGFNNEFDLARQISEEFGTRHHEITIGPDSIKHLQKITWYLDEPIADPTSIPNYILSKKASRYVKVLINGDGADELFCGYEQYKLMKLHEYYSKLPKIFRTCVYEATKKSNEPFFMKLKDFISPDNSQEKSYHALISVFGTSEKKKVVNDSIMGAIDLPRVEKRMHKVFMHAHSPLSKMSYHDIITFLPDNMLVKYDKMTMASSVEGRVPYCDHRIAEFAASLPLKYKIKGWEDKSIIRESLKDILPQNIIRRKKQRFLVPTDNWMDRGYKEYAEQLFSEEAETVRRYFKKEYVSDLLNHKRFISSKLLKLNSLTNLYYSRQLWTLTNFILWNKTFMEGDINRFLGTSD
ncbi:MAG: asparagine synthase (glutamine-hydrolyzing) [archaeon]